jgi:hypothetical protein
VTAYFNLTSSACPDTVGLKPDGIWESSRLVRLKLKLHRLKPDGIRNIDLRCLLV